MLSLFFMVPEVNLSLSLVHQVLVGMSSPMAGSAASSSKERPASRTSFIPELQGMMYDTLTQTCTHRKSEVRILTPVQHGAGAAEQTVGGHENLLNK